MDARPAVIRFHCGYGQAEMEKRRSPKEKRFETCAYGLNTDPPTYDHKKPMLQEYGPLDVHELRERYMVDRIKEYMEPFNVGLFIVGLAHLHSTLSKLKTASFEVRGYSWVEQ